VPSAGSASATASISRCGRDDIDLVRPRQAADGRHGAAEPRARDRIPGLVRQGHARHVPDDDFVAYVPERPSFAIPSMSATSCWPPGRRAAPCLA
jgi:hypothetical protein